jgi:hypothetical protein
MHSPWFVPFGWFYRPVALPGWLATLAWPAYVIPVFIAIDRGSHSASDTLYGVFPHAAAAFLLWDWLARRTRPAASP